MIDGVGIEGMDQAKIVRQPGGVREQFTHPNPALALPGELKSRWRYKLLLASSHRGDTLPLADGLGQLGLEKLMQVRLVIEKIHLARGTGHEQENDAFRLGLGD